MYLLDIQVEKLIPILIIAIPIMAIAGGIVVGVVRMIGQQRLLELAQRERIAAIERGIDPGKIPTPSIFDENIVQREDQLPVDVRPVRRVGWLYDDGAVKTHLLREVFPDVWVVPIKPGIGELELIGECASDRDRSLRVVRDAVETIVQP